MHRGRGGETLKVPCTRQQDEMEQVSAREQVRVQEMRELQDEYNALQLRHTALLQTQETASVAIAESLVEAEEALKEREADAKLTADKLASLMEEVAALKQTLKESGKQVCVPCAHSQAYTPALIYTQASIRSAADRRGRGERSQPHCTPDLQLVLPKDGTN